MSRDIVDRCPETPAAEAATVVSWCFLRNFADNRGWSAADSEYVADNNFPDEFDAHTDALRGEDQRR